MKRLRELLDHHALDLLVLATFVAGYLFALLAPAPAVQLVTLGGALFLLARLYERTGGPWAP